MAGVPEDTPANCPTCGRVYESVTVHEEGVMVNLLENERYHRVCLEPGAREGDAVLYFYHHTHQQAEASSHAKG
jgi:hypothetical protein